MSLYSLSIIIQISHQVTPTLRHWIHYLGFLQDKLKNSYHVYGHEHEDQKRHSSGFTQKCLSHLKPLSQCWVQVSSDNVESITSSLPANNQRMTSIRYNDSLTDVECIEFCVEDHDCMQDQDNEMHSVHSGNVSILDQRKANNLSSLAKMNQSSINSCLVQSSG